MRLAKSEVILHFLAPGPYVGRGRFVGQPTPFVDRDSQSLISGLSNKVYNCSVVQVVLEKRSVKVERSKKTRFKKIHDCEFEGLIKALSRLYQGFIKAVFCAKILAIFAF